jgi:hypothetical protein
MIRLNYDRSWATPRSSVAGDLKLPVDSSPAQIGQPFYTRPNPGDCDWITDVGREDAIDQNAHVK